MRFLDYVNDVQLVKEIHDLVDLPLLEDIGMQIQNPGQILKRDIDRLVYQTAQELQIWAEQMQQAGRAQGTEASLVSKILANPNNAATALIRQYVVANVKA